MASGTQNNTSYQAQKWTNLRSFTIGETGKNVDGTTNISWSKNEILGVSDDSKFLRGDKTWSNTLTGPFNVLTQTSVDQALSICCGSITEGVRIWVNDSYTNFYVENDEKTANVEFRLHATDTESGGGAGENTSYVRFNGENGKSTVIADVFSGALSGNADTATKATQDGAGNVITAKYVTLDTDQTNITGSKRFTKAVQCYRYTTNNNLPAITMDKPGANYIGIGADGTTNRIKFGPCSSLDGASWVAQSSFNSNQWFFQGSIYGTSTLTIESSASISGGITSQHGHIFNVAGNEFNWIPDGYNSSMWFNYETFNRANNGTVTEYICGNGKHGHANLRAAKVYNAVWNDFAEYREGTTTEAGRVVAATADSNKVSLTYERLQPCAHVISDTFGCSVGQSDTAQTPIGVGGRVLVYPYQSIENYHVGDCLCAAPDGTADIMTREEIIQYPDRIIGIVDEIPSYLVWKQALTTDKEKNGSGKVETNVQVNGRIWIYVR